MRGRISSGAAGGTHHGVDFRGAGREAPDAGPATPQQEPAIPAQPATPPRAERVPRGARWARRAVLGVVLGVVLAAGPALAVSDELSFHQAVVDYSQGRLEAAERGFQRVLRNRPDDPAALQYLGLIARAQDRIDEALQLLYRAAELAPDDPAPLTRVAEILLAENVDAQAREAIDRALPLAPEDPELHLLAGIADFRLRAFRDALEHLEIAARDPDLRREARYYAGLSEVFRGEVYAATTAFEEVATLSPAHPLGQSAAALSESIEPRLPDADWAVGATLGSEVDSNPTVVSDLFDREVDGRGVFQLRANVRPYHTRDLALGLGYEGFVSVHGRTSEVDDQTHVARASARYDAGPAVLGLTYDFAYTLLELTEPFRMRHRVEPSASFRTGRLGILRTSYELEVFDFEEASAPEFDRSGLRHSAGASQLFYLADPLRYAQLGVTGSYYDADGSEFRTAGVDVFGRLVGELPWLAIEPSLAYRFGFRHHLEDSALGTNEDDPVQRDDLQHLLQVGVTIPVGARLTLGLTGSAVFVDSSLDDFDYDRFTGGLYASYEF